jgi:RNA polymerase sigma-70 factor (ECF subfamily)
MHIPGSGGFLRFSAIRRGRPGRELHNSATIRERSEMSAMSSGGDGERDAAGTPPTEREDTIALGQRLEGFRAYLLLVANRQMSPGLQAKCGASDLVQQTFFEAVRDRGAYRGLTNHQVRGWLRAILVNTIRDVARSYGLAKRKVALEVPIEPGLIDCEPTPGARAVAREQAEAVDAALVRLPDDYRRVIELRNREGWPFGEIGAALGRSADAARMLWFRAVERLQQELTKIDAA